MPPVFLEVEPHDMQSSQGSIYRSRQKRQFASMADGNCDAAKNGEQSPQTQSKTALQVVRAEPAIVSSKSYGKGRIVERKKKGTGQLTFPRTRPPGELALRPHTAKRHPDWIEEGTLGACDLTRETAAKTAWQLIHSSAPALLTNLQLAGNLPTVLSVDSLGEIFEAAQEVDVLVCIGEENKFQKCNEENNVFGSFYHVREPRCKTLRMPFMGFSQHLQQWRSKGIMLKLKCREWKAEDEKGRKFVLQESPGYPEALQQLLTENVTWDWLQGLQKYHRLGAVTEAAIEIGGRNSLLPASYSTQDQIIVQVKGVRRVLIIDPKYSFSGMYPFAVHHPYDGHSMVDWEAPDESAWPACQGVRGRVCLLQPGDVLFVPSCWWVQQQLMEPENIALKFTLGMTGQLRQLPAQALRVSRVVEELIGDLQGPQKILYWLELLSKEEEEDVIDWLSTPGFLQLEAVWDARETVDSVLGWNAWKDLFPVMCVGRLRATPWLNQNFKEPLYLTDKPRLIKDTRNEEQQKYPELFRHAQ